MASRIKIGLVGAGDIGRVHAQAYQRLPDVDLVVARGRNPSKADALARSLGAGLADSVDALLADDSIDAVDLCVPNDLHCPLALAAARAGKATLCEKPIALTLADAEQIVEAFERDSIPLMIAHVVRFWPEYAQAREMITAGDLGDIQAFSARRLISLLQSVEGAEGWRHAPQRNGGAALDLQIHDIDFALWTFGLPRRVVARGVRSEFGSFDHVYTLLEYADGLVVGIESSFLLKGDPVVIDFRAVGRAASLAFSFVSGDFAMHGLDGGGDAEPSRAGPASLVRYSGGRGAEVIREQAEDPVSLAFENEVRAFVQLVRGDQVAGVPTPRESLDALRVALASLESCETGKAIAL